MSSLARFRLQPLVALLLAGAALVRADTTSGTACRWFDSTSTCVSTPCPGTDGAIVSTCLTTPPCPAGCQEKDVAGTAESLCALASAPADPFDLTNTQTFLECTQDGSTTPADECSAAITGHFAAMGCDAECRVAWVGRDARGDQCATSTTSTACESTTVPCDGTSAPAPTGPIGGTTTTTTTTDGTASPPAPGPTSVLGSGPSAQGTNDLGQDLGLCFYNERTGNCQQPRCEGDPWDTWTTCARASPPCPETCLEKPVAGAEGVNVCAVVGSHIDPIDRATAQGFIECTSGSSDDPQCGSIFGEYAVATGCTPECFEASNGGPRNEVCDVIPDNSEATCSATEITAVCPNYPPVVLASDAEVTPPPPAPPAPPAPTSVIPTDPAPEPEPVEPVESTEDADTMSENGSGTRALAPPPTAASGPDFGSTSSPTGVETIQEAGASATVGAAIVVGVVLAAVAAVL